MQDPLPKDLVQPALVEDASSSMGAIVPELSAVRCRDGIRICESAPLLLWIVPRGSFAMDEPDSQLLAGELFIAAVMVNWSASYRALLAKPVGIYSWRIGVGAAIRSSVSSELSRMKPLELASELSLPWMGALLVTLAGAVYFCGSPTRTTQSAKRIRWFIYANKSWSFTGCVKVPK